QRQRHGAAETPRSSRDERHLTRHVEAWVRRQKKASDVSIVTVSVRLEGLDKKSLISGLCSRYVSCRTC
ncbi:MAG: hypothetical protein QOC60_720, partial [Frankiaceae bacterium]|nr:hypothetical protein [Frankiaceae bacterium]